MLARPLACAVAAGGVLRLRYGPLLPLTPPGMCPPGDESLLVRVLCILMPRGCSLRLLTKGRGASAEARHARCEGPVGRGDTCFAQPESEVVNSGVVSTQNAQRILACWPRLQQISATRFTARSAANRNSRHDSDTSGAPFAWQ